MTIALFSVFFFTIPISSLGGAAIDIYDIIPRSWVISVVPFLMYFYLSNHKDIRRGIIYLVLWAILFNINPLTAALFIVLPFICLILQEGEPFRKRLSHGVIYSVVAVSLALLTLPFFGPKIQTVSLSPEFLTKFMELRLSYQLLQNQLGLVIFVIAPLVIMALISLLIKKKNRLDWILVAFGFIQLLSTAIAMQMTSSLNLYIHAQRFTLFIPYIAGLYAFALPILSYKQMREKNCKFILKNYRFIVGAMLLCVYITSSIVLNYGNYGETLYTASENYGDFILLPVKINYGFNTSNIEKWTIKMQELQQEELKLEAKKIHEINMYTWIKENTPVVSIILADPKTTNLKFYLQTHRALVVNHKIFTPDDSKLIMEWYERYVKIQDAYKNGNLTNLHKLAKKYNASYILIDTMRYPSFSNVSERIVHTEGDLILLEV